MDTSADGPLPLGRTPGDDARSELERELGAQKGPVSLSRGILVFRAGSLAWMVILNLVSGGFARPWLAYLCLAAAAVWTGWLWLHPDDQRLDWALWLDLFLTACLILASALVLPHGGVVSPHRLFFATAYPVSTPLMWAMSKRVPGGLLSGVVLSVALFLTRPLNHVAIHHVSDVIGVANGSAYFLIGGYTIGFIADALDRSAASMTRAVDRVLEGQRAVAEARQRAAEEERAAAEAREREAGMVQWLALREQIHLKILNEYLPRIMKPLQERAAHSNDEQLRTWAKQLSRAAGELRYLIGRPYEQMPAGLVFLEDRLRKTAASVEGVSVTWAVSYACISYGAADHMCAAVEQALQNVDRHAGCDEANVQVGLEDGRLLISVLDHGAGFDATALRRGIGFEDMERHIGALDGEMRVDSAAGEGTAIEFSLPIQPDWVVR